MGKKIKKKKKKNWEVLREKLDFSRVCRSEKKGKKKLKILATKRGRIHVNNNGCVKA